MLILMTSSSFASIINVAVTPEGDGVYNVSNSPYSLTSKYFDVNASPNTASYYYYVSSGTTTETNTAYAQFSLESVSTLQNIINVSLNLYILDATQDENLNSPGKINHSTSDGSGQASQKLSGNELVGSVTAGASGWTSFDVTTFVLQDIANNHSWSAFSFNYDGSYHTWSYYRTSGFSFASAEQGNAAFLSFTTSDSSGDPVPEPGTMLLMTLGLTGLIGVHRKKHRN
jgi:hypothetical protein